MLAIFIKSIHTRAGQIIEPDPNPTKPYEKVSKWVGLIGLSGLRVTAFGFEWTVMVESGC